MAAQFAVATAAWADEPIVYPAKGQNQAQQERDEFECHEWAKKDTGVDPVALAEKSLAATPSTSGGAPRGGGGLLGMLRAKRQLREQQSSGSSQAASIKPEMEKYDRAYAACLTGRGYTVN